MDVNVRFEGCGPTSDAKVKIGKNGQPPNSEVKKGKQRSLQKINKRDGNGSATKAKGKTAKQRNLERTETMDGSEPKTNVKGKKAKQRNLERTETIDGSEPKTNAKGKKAKQRNLEMTETMDGSEPKTNTKVKKAKQRDLATGRVKVKFEESGPNNTLKKINRKTKLQKATADDVSSSLLAVAQTCMKKTYNTPEGSISKLSPLGKGKLTVERLRQMAYSTALSAATANGKGVVGLGKGRNGKQCLYFLAPIQFSKTKTSEQKFLPVSSTVTSIAATNSTEIEEQLPEFTEVLQSSNIPMVSGASEDYPATILDQSSVATNSFLNVGPSDTSESSFSDPNQADDTWINEFFSQPGTPTFADTDFDFDFGISDEFVDMTYRIVENNESNKSLDYVGFNSSSQSRNSYFPGVTYCSC